MPIHSSEATESAIKLARQYALARGEEQRFKVISRTPSYHGSTLGALAVAGYGPLTAPFDPMMRPRCRRRGPISMALTPTIRRLARITLRCSKT